MTSFAMGLRRHAHTLPGGKLQVFTEKQQITDSQKVTQRPSTAENYHTLRNGMRSMVAFTRAMLRTGLPLKSMPSVT
ncbi:hypothetical protein Esi_0513_0004 [Ectocarpus siliculosus]|uniref:Uncharacterized protein n=1 Tax=Ectocarpus siliculosus TaxID=2880 RepID=D7G3M5_ECTSI|nr:hypothetical protein Esi_0513_0004 [Ectocarpus siliculosus]|eukprot:CBJ33557.1 hypothetical protein Esi_0513_0004 [Ectocarpus siliculosus]